ncbi:MAG: hypothetical protein ACXAAO_00490 [Candidatus Thorarchaeota archaeon]
MFTWGSKGWRIMSFIVSIGLLGLGTYGMVTGLLSGSPIWWYNSSVTVFGFTILGLAFLVREGFKAFDNLMKYGRNPATTLSFENDDYSTTNDEPMSLEDQMDIQIDTPSDVED